MYSNVTPTLTHSAKRIDALRKSRVEYVAMMGSTKMTTSASSLSVAFHIHTRGVSALGILIVGVLLLITGCGPPI
jgi:hypothetical protein